MTRSGATVMVLAGVVGLVGAVWSGKSRLAGTAPQEGETVGRRSVGRVRLMRAGGAATSGSGALEGVVLDAQGAPAGGAQVVLSHASEQRWLPGPDSVVQADARGQFHFGDLAAGQYRVTAAVARPGVAPAISEELALASGERRTVELRLGGEAAALRGRVLESGGGPLAGAVLTAIALQEPPENTTPPFVLLRTTADVAGSYLLNLRRGKYALMVQAEGYVTHSDRIELAADIDRDFRLDAGASISGRVLEHGGKPLAGAEVTARSVGMVFIGGSDREPSVTSDAGGGFHLGGLASGAYRVEARQGKLVGASDELQLAAGQSMEAVTILCEVSFSLSGRVVQPDGTPPKQAWVSATGHPLESTDVPSAEVDAAGSFRLTGLVPGSYRLRVTVMHGPRAEKSVRIADQDLTGVVIQLGPDQVVNGQVVDPQGRPVPRARVSVQVRLSGNARSSSAGMSDEQGRFRIGGVESGTATIQAHHPEVGSASWGPRPMAEVLISPIRLELEAGAAVTGQVRFEGGKPAPGATVRALYGDGSGDLVDAEVVADPEGRYLMRGLKSGQVELQPSPADSSRGEQQTVRVTLGAGEKKPMDLVIARPKTVRGRVLLPDGKPAAGARVTAVAGDAISPGSGAPRVLTDGDGRFTFEDLEPADRYSLWADLAGYGDARAEGVPVQAGNLTLRLSTESSLAGVVVYGNGKPVSDFQLQLWRTDESGGVARRSVAASDLGLRGHRTVRDPGGAFAVRSLAPGSYQLHVVAPGGHAGRLMVAVAAGEHRRNLRLQLEGGIGVRGRLVDAESGRPLAGVTVRALGGGGQESVESGADGAFDLGQVTRADELRLMFELEDQGYHFEPEVLAVPAGASTVDVGTLRFLKGDYIGKMAGGAPGVFGFSFDVREGNLVVTQVFPGLPADRAGLQSGDRVLAVEGKRLAGLSTGSRLYLLRGKVGSNASLTVQSGAREREVTLVREAWKP